MLISALGRVSVFPGISDADITSASFHQVCGMKESRDAVWMAHPNLLLYHGPNIFTKSQLRADGGFLISSKRSQGSTLFVRINATSSGNLTLRVRRRSTQKGSWQTCSQSTSLVLTLWILYIFKAQGMSGPWAFDPSSVNYKMLSEDTVFMSGLETGDTGAYGVT